MSSISIYNLNSSLLDAVWVGLIAGAVFPALATNVAEFYTVVASGQLLAMVCLVVGKIVDPRHVIASSA